MISPSSPSDIRNVYCTFKQGRFSKITNDTNSRKQARENSPHFATPPLRNERRNFILMTRHYPDLGSASDWLKKIFHAARPIRSTTKIWVMTRYQYAIPAPVSQKSFSGKPVVQSQNVSCFFFKKTWKTNKKNWNTGSHTGFKWNSTCFVICTKPCNQLKSVKQLL